MKMKCVRILRILDFNTLLRPAKGRISLEQHFNSRAHRLNPSSSYLKTCLAVLSARSSHPCTIRTPARVCPHRAMLASPAQQYDTPATTSTIPARPSKRPKRSSPDAELNVESVVLCNYLIKPSFPSLYREEIVGTGAIKRLYVCKGCFKYTKDAAAHIAHRVSSRHYKQHQEDANRYCSASVTTSTNHPAILSMRKADTQFLKSTARIIRYVLVITTAPT